jgi:hypothetical protein
LAIGASLLDIKKATTLASVTVMTFMLAGGFFVKVSALPDVVTAEQNISQKQSLGLEHRISLS